MKQIVIVGGGFGGLRVAQGLERSPGIGKDFEVTLISRDNFLLFTSFLTEVLGGMLNEADVASPLRAFLKKSRFVMGEVTAIDVHARTVTCKRPLTDDEEVYQADHLVLSLGSTTSFHGQDEVERFAYTLKSLDDATLLRNRLIALLEQANEESDPQARQGFLTVTVVGAGYTGVEGAAAILDLMKEAARQCPRVRPDEVRVVLVDAVTEILPMIDPALAAYAKGRMQRRGIELRLGQTIAHASAQSITLSGGEQFPCRTLLWSAGVQPPPLTKTLNVALDKKGAINVEPTMAIPGVTGAWAMGDCAHIPNLLEDGRPYPPTAQHAEREAKQLARNILLTLDNKTPQPFLFRTLGTFVNLGERDAVAQIKGIKFSGLLAWLLWRTVYLSKIPHWSRKARVATGWGLDMVFGRSSVETEAPRLLRGRAALREEGSSHKRPAQQQASPQAAARDD